MRSSKWHGFSLMEAVVALSITSLIIGALGFLLIYATRTLKQSFSDSTVQQQGIVAMRKLSDDLIQSNIYSVYSVGNSYNPLASPPGGMNVTFLSPYEVNSQAVSRMFYYDAGPDRLRFQTWVGYCVDASQKLIRYDNNSPSPPYTDPPVSMNPAFPLLRSPLSVADMTVGAANQHSSRVITKGVALLNSAGTPITDGFSVDTGPTGVPRYLTLNLKLLDFYGSGSDQFHQLNFTTRLYPRN